MAIIYADDSGPIIWPLTEYHDPESKKYYYIDYMPATRQNSKAYIKDVDLIVPPVFNGCMYQCISGGISAPSIPTFTTIEGGTVDDGDVKWRVKPYAAKLLFGDTITSSTWTGDTGVVFTNSSLILDGITAACRVDAVPSGAKRFTITNHIVINRATGRIEEFEKSLVISIKQL